jgi:chemotaxis protein CheD
MQTAMKHIVGVADMKISNHPEDVIVTHSLGSCIGVCIHDPVAHVGGMLHFQLPLSQDNPSRAMQNPCAYADTGIPALFKAAYRLGADKKRIRVKVAGGARVLDDNNFFNIGQRNYVVMKKIFWKNGVFIDQEDVGGAHWRTMSMEIGSGNVIIKTPGGRHEL